MQRKINVKPREIHGGDQEFQPNYKSVLIPGVTPAATRLKRALKLAETDNLLEEIHTAQIALLNEDLAREYDSIVSSLLYSQVARSSEFFNSAAELERHAAEEINHAGLIEDQIEILGGSMLDLAKQVQTFASADGMFRFDAVSTMDRITHYRRRIRQCEGRGEYAVVAIMRVLLEQEQDHQLAMKDAVRLDHESHSDQEKSQPALEPVTNLCCDDLRFVTTSYTIFNSKPNRKGKLIARRHHLYRSPIADDEHEARQVGELPHGRILTLEPSV
jgi:bacterioferritin